jgi:NTP pyrophosphatase (non-canonical NTP hydrolase)
MQPLALSASLGDVQDYVAKMETERGLAGLSVDSQCLKLAEEVGELTAAALDHHDEIAGECVDVLILLTSIANRVGIDLATAVHRRSPGPGTVGLTHLSARAPSTGFAELDLTRLCMRAAIETGEVCRAVRELLGNPSDPQGRTVALADTCADLALLIGAIAGRQDFDLAESWRAKEAINNGRTWT